MPIRIVRIFVVAMAVFIAGTAVPAAQAAPRGAPFLAGAAVADFTPAAFGRLGRPDPADCISGTPLEAIFSGRRPFAFTEPYIDLGHVGHYQLADPFVDCNHDGRWDGNLIGGGTNGPRFAEHVADPVTARALAVSAGGRTTVVEVVDQEGLFDVYQARIRQLATAALARLDRRVDDIFISATHDESAPDSLGLGGVSQATSGVNAYFVDFLVTQAADAVVRAVLALQPAHLRFAEAIEPANLRQCWSSYPYVDDQLMPAVQAVANRGPVIATLASVSQHAETLGFNRNPTEASWITADWPNFFRRRLEQRYGGVAIEMAGAVGSNETPQVFTHAVSPIPRRFVGASHPAGCATVFPAAGTPVPTGYDRETRLLGQLLADAVGGALDQHGTWSGTNTLWGRRVSVCLPFTNALFLVAAAAGVFAARPAYGPGCLAASPAAPDGSTAGTSVLTQVAAFRIGDGEFASVPGEVFPFTYLGSFLGPDDLPYAQASMPPVLTAHMTTAYRFVDGLAEDMVGYIFPAGNGVGVPGERPVDNRLGTTDTDRFGCGHSDDAEAATSAAGDLLGRALVGLLGPSESTMQGRYVLPDGVLSRDPLSRTGSIGCTVGGSAAFAGRAVALWAPGKGVVVPAAWLSLSGRRQDAPDRNTRGWVDAHGAHHWLDVYAAIAGAPTKVSPPPRG